MPFGSLGLGLGLGGRRVGDAGNMPATFTIAAGSVDDGIKRINFSETITVTITGDVTADFGDGQGELTAGTHTVSNALDYWTLKITGGTGGGTITFGKRKQVTYLYLAYLNSLVVKGDITGMKLTSLLLYSLGLSTITGDISGMGLTYLQGARDPGELPATFSIAAGSVDTGIKRINFSEPVTVTMTGGVTLSIGSTQYQSGDTIPVASSYHELTINNPGEDGTITFGKRKQITYLLLTSLGSSVITGDITGMKLTYLRLAAIGSSVITGDITGMELTILYLNNLGSSLTYGTNPLKITNTSGIQLQGNTVFATAAEYARLIHDAAIATWGGKHPFRIDAGTNDNCPDWDTVKADVAVLLTKAAWTIIPSAWLSDNGGSWPSTWNEYAGELPATFTVTAGDGTKYVRVQVSETTTVTPAGGTSIRIGSSGDFVTAPLTLAANTNQDIYFKDAGSFTIPKRKLVTYLTLYNLGSSVITGDITGMKLTYLYLDNIGSSVITGDITGMPLTYLLLNGIGSSVIEGEITGMELIRLYLNGIGSSLTYGTNSLNITHSNGIQLQGNTVFATAAEYAQLIHDAAIATWGGKHPFVITAGTSETDPGWENVKAYVAILLTKAAWTIIPSAWLTTGGGSWPLNWQEYTGE